MKNKKYLVLTAGIILALAFGILYSWSIIKVELEKTVTQNSSAGYKWDLSSLNDPYSLAVLVFAFTMIISGRIQDKIGPRITTYIGGILVFTGFVITSLSDTYISWIVGYGIFTGVGIGFGYAAITPVVIKWFPPEKAGLVTGLVVAGFGLSSIYIAPLYNFMIKSYGLSNTMLYYGIGFFIIVCISAFFLVNPEKSKNVHNKNNIDFNKSKKSILKSGDFYYLWFLYFIGAGAGLMVIGFVTELVKKDLIELAFLGVVIIAIGNSVGRIVSGILSDKIGCFKTLMIFFIFQTLLMSFAYIFLSGNFSGTYIIIFIATFIGFNYGSNLTLFPTITKELWGMENFGTNYGLLYTAWGVGGFILSRVSQMLTASTGTLNYSFLLAALLLFSGVILLLLIYKNKKFI